MELKGKKGDFDYAQSPKHLPENLRNPNGADRCLNDRSLSEADRGLSGAEGSGYKQTEIGVIPEDWDLKKLNLIGEIVTGSTPSTYNIGYWNGNIPWITPTDITDSKDIFFGARSLTEQGFNQIRQLPKDTVLITCIASIGKNAILRINGGCNQQINAIIPNKHHSSEFVYYLIEGNKDYLRSLAGITATPIISKKDFTDFIFSFPPLPEQQKIAEALSDTDALIQSLKKLIAKKKDIKQGAMQELLSGKRRLEGFKGEWVEKKLGDAGKTIGGLAGKVKNDFGNGNGKYITFLNVMNNVKIDTSILEKVLIKQGEKQNSFVYGDLFFNTSSETPEEVGMCAVLLENIDDLYLNSFCFGFRLHNDLVFDGLFLAYLINSSIGRKIFESLAQGATRYNLSKTNFNNIHLFVPHSIQEQTAIAQILSDMDAEIEALEKKLQKIEFLKQGMMQELLTGRIRLVKTQAEMPAMVAEPTQNYKTH